VGCAPTSRDKHKCVPTGDKLILTSRGVIVRLLIFGVAALVVGVLASLVSDGRELGMDRHAFRLLELARGSFLADVAKPASKIAPVILAIVVLVAARGLLISSTSSTLCVGFIAIRVHYLSDVIAGWAFGIAAFTCCDLVQCSESSLLL
jgi:hypothetical protein